MNKYITLLLIACMAAGTASANINTNIADGNYLDGIYENFNVNLSSNLYNVSNMSGVCPYTLIDARVDKILVICDDGEDDGIVNATLIQLNGPDDYTETHFTLTNEHSDGIAVAASLSQNADEIYVAYTEANRLTKYDLSGTLVWEHNTTHQDLYAKICTFDDIYDNTCSYTDFNTSNYNGVAELIVPHEYGIAVISQKGGLGGIGYYMSYNPSGTVISYAAIIHGSAYTATEHQPRTIREKDDNFIITTDEGGTSTDKARYIEVKKNHGSYMIRGNDGIGGCNIGSVWSKSNAITNGNCPVKGDPAIVAHNYNDSNGTWCDDVICGNDSMLASDVDWKPGLGPSHIYTEYGKHPYSDPTDRDSDYELNGSAIYDPNNGYLYVYDSNDGLYAMDTSDASIVWREEYTNGFYLGATPAVTDEYLIVGTINGNLTVKDKTDGSNIATWRSGYGAPVHQPRHITNSGLDYLVMPAQSESDDSWIVYYLAGNATYSCTNHSECAAGQFCDGSVCQDNNITLNANVTGSLTYFEVEEYWNDSLDDVLYRLYEGPQEDNITTWVTSVASGEEKVYSFAEYPDKGTTYYRVLATNGSKWVGGSNILTLTYGNNCSEDADCLGGMYCNMNGTCAAPFDLNATVIEDWGSVRLDWVDQAETAFLLGCESFDYYIYRSNDSLTWTKIDEVWWGSLSYLDSSPNLNTTSYYLVIATCWDYNQLSKSEVANVSGYGGFFEVNSTEYFNSSGGPVVYVDWTVYPDSRVDYYSITRNGTVIAEVAAPAITNIGDDDIEVGIIYQYGVQAMEEYIVLGVHLPWFDTVLVENYTNHTVEGCPVYNCTGDYGYYRCNGSSHFCVEGCSNNSDCVEEYGQGWYCNNYTFTCQQSDIECRFDDECSAGEYCDNYTMTSTGRSLGECKDKLADNESCRADNWCDSGSCSSTISSSTIAQCEDDDLQFDLCMFDGNFGSCGAYDYCYTEGFCQGETSNNCTHDANCTDAEYCAIETEGSGYAVCLPDLSNNESGMYGVYGCERDEWCDGHQAEWNTSQCLEDRCVPYSWECITDDSCTNGACNQTSHACVDCLAIGEDCAENGECCTGNCIGNILNATGFCIDSDLECYFNPEETDDMDPDMYCHCLEVSLGDAYTETPESDNCALWTDATDADEQPEFCHSRADDVFGPKTYECYAKLRAGETCGYDWQCLSGECSLISGNYICVGGPANLSATCTRDNDCPTSASGCGNDYWSCVSGFYGGRECFNHNDYFYSCLSDTECSTTGKYQCVASACTFMECTSDTQCGTGSYCDTACGYCRFKQDVGYECEDDSECSGGYCINGFCEARECTYDADCTGDPNLGEGYVCIGGECIVGTYTITVVAQNNHNASGKSWDYVVDCEKNDNGFNISTTRESLFYFQRPNEAAQPINSDYSLNYSGPVRLCRGAFDDTDDTIVVDRIYWQAQNIRGQPSNQLSTNVALLEHSLEANISILSESGDNITWQVLVNRPSSCMYTFAKSGDEGNYSAPNGGLFGGTYATNITKTITTPTDMNRAFFTVRCYDQYGYNVTEDYGFKMGAYTDYVFDAAQSIVFWVFIAFIILPTTLIYYLAKKRSSGES